MSIGHLTSLAILKINLDTGSGDYLDNFVPFVAEAVLLANEHLVSTESIDQKLLEQFGLSIPEGVLRTILRRMSKRGLIERSDHQYKRNPVKLQKLSLGSKRQQANHEMKRLVEYFRTYVRDRHSLTLTQNEAESIIAQEISANSLDLLSTDPEPAIALSNDTKPVQFDRRFIFASFVHNSFVENLDSLRLIEQFARAAMIAESIAFPSDLSSSQKLKNLTVYLDTKVALNLLGYDSEYRKKAAVALVKLIQSLEGKVAIFEETFDEISSILKATQTSLQQGPDSSKTDYSVYRFALQRGMSSSDMRLRQSRLKNDLLFNSVQIHQIPESSHEDFAAEERLETLIASSINYVNVTAKEHDVVVLAGISRLRIRQSPRDLSQARAVFVTTNHSLSKAASTYFDEPLKGQVIPHCIPDDLFTTMMWARSPSSSPSIPLLQFVAECHAAISPSDTLWAKYLSEAKRLKESGNISPEDYTLLVFEDLSRSCLMEATHGNVGAVVEGSVLDVLYEVRERVATESSQEAKAQQLARLEAEKNLLDERQKRIEQEVAHDQRSKYFANFIVSTLEKLLMTVALLGLVGSFFIANIAAKSVAIVVCFAIAFNMVLSVFSIARCNPVHQWLDRLEKALARKIKGS